MSSEPDVKKLSDRLKELDYRYNIATQVDAGAKNEDFAHCTGAHINEKIYWTKFCFL